MYPCQGVFLNLRAVEEGRGFGKYTVNRFLRDAVVFDVSAVLGKVVLVHVRMGGVQGLLHESCILEAINYPL